MNVEPILALEDRRCQATVAGDVETLGELFADNLCYTHSHGGMDTKASLIANLVGGVFVYRGIERTDVAVAINGSTAVVTGRARLEITAAGTERTVHCRFTNVWALDDSGTWRFVAWQSTPVAAD